MEAFLPRLLMIFVFFDCRCCCLLLNSSIRLPLASNIEHLYLFVYFSPIIFTLFKQLYFCAWHGFHRGAFFFASVVGRLRYISDSSIWRMIDRRRAKMEFFMCEMHRVQQTHTYTHTQPIGKIGTHNLCFDLYSVGEAGGDRLCAACNIFHFILRTFVQRQTLWFSIVMLSARSMKSNSSN